MLHGLHQTDDDGAVQAARINEKTPGLSRILLFAERVSQSGGQFLAVFLMYSVYFTDASRAEEKDGLPPTLLNALSQPCRVHVGLAYRLKVYLDPEGGGRTDSSSTHLNTVKLAFRPRLHDVQFM